MPKKLKTILSIAGSDPTGGAGIQADIRIGSFLGLQVATAITAVTIQNSHGLKKIGAVSNDLLKEQIEAVLSDCVPDAIKIGMLGSKENLFIVSEFLKNALKDIPVVIDPVFAVSSNKKILMEKIDELEWASLYKNYLFPYSELVIPNIKELRILIGDELNEALKFRDIREKLGIKNLLITQGDTDEREINDCLYLNGEIINFKHPKIKCRNLHGTGCVFSTMMASFLAKGLTIFESFKMSNKYIEKIIKNSRGYVWGKSKYGPLNINNYTFC